MNQEEK